MATFSSVATNFEVIGASLADVDPEIDAFTDAAVDTVEASYLDSSNYLTFQLKISVEHTAGKFHDFRMKVKDTSASLDAAGLTALKTRLQAITGDFIAGITATIAESHYSSVVSVRGKGRIWFGYLSA